MSWSLLVMPLHTLAEEDGLEWATEASFTYGIPDRMPPTRDLPTTQQILLAFRLTGCHGAAWFDLSGQDVSATLPPCPNPMTCADDGGLDLGEVSLQTLDNSQLELQTPIAAITFRKPRSRAVLAVTMALASQAGPQLVFDDSADTVFVVSAEDDPHRMAESWPW